MLVNIYSIKNREKSIFTTMERHNHENLLYGMFGLTLDHVICRRRFVCRNPICTWIFYYLYLGIEITTHHHTDQSENLSFCLSFTSVILVRCWLPHFLRECLHALGYHTMYISIFNLLHTGFHSICEERITTRRLIYFMELRCQYQRITDDLSSS